MKAVTTLHHFALVNFAADPARLRAIIPTEFALDQTSSGETLVSAVPFRDSDFRYPLFPWMGFDFWQINYRAYVIERATGRRCVWFFGTDLGSLLVHIPRIQWGLPWHHARFTDEVEPHRYRLESRSALSHSLFDFSSDKKPAHLSPSDFELLTNPMRGFYRLRSGDGIGTYQIEHLEMKLRETSSAMAHVSLFERLGLTVWGQAPHSVYVADPIEFRIQLPPTLY